MIGKLMVRDRGPDGGISKASVNAERDGKTEIYKLSGEDGWVPVLEVVVETKQKQPKPNAKPKEAGKELGEATISWYRVAPKGKPEGWVRGKHIIFQPSE